MRTILSYHWHQLAGQKQFLDSTAIPTRKWVSPCHNFSLAKLCFFGTNGGVSLVFGSNEVPYRHPVIFSDHRLRCYLLNMSI